jgi:TRAP-type C4-dicarboxylate transport system substrate-binding protein
MAADWSRVTNGEVELIVFHNAVAGSEAEVLRKLRGNQIQAAIFTSAGLVSVMPEVMTLSYPLLIRTDAELEEVLKKLDPELNAIVERNGFVTLSWTRAGWLKIFSKTPVFTSEDLKKLKLGTNPDDLKMMQAFKAMGFQMIPVNINEVMNSLNSGMIDAIYQSPISFAADQLFGIAKNMSSISIAPFMGGILMNRTAWNRIPARYRPRLLEICKQLETEIGGSIAGLEREAISIMVNYGLVINQASEQQEREWINYIASRESSLVPVFNETIYRKITAVLNDFRKGR